MIYICINYTIFPKSGNWYIFVLKFNQMKKLIPYILFLFLIGCKSSKQTDFKDVSTVKTETIKTESTRKGDSLSVTRPFNITLKDTVIYTKSTHSKQYIRETYDKEGNQKIDCVSDELKELIETTKILAENNITFQEQRKNEFNPASFVWAIVGLGMVMLLLFSVLFFMYMKLQKQIPSLIANSIKGVKF